MLVDRTGFPLEIGCFEGNTAETTTLVPIITAFAARHDLGDTPMVVAADAGMLSATNLTALDDAGLGFIVGSRAVKAPIDLASHFHWNGDVFTDGQIIDTVTPRHAKSVVNDTNKRAEPVWNADTHAGAWRAVWAYSAKRARRDQKTLHAQEARAKAVVSGERAAKSTRFVKTTAGGRALDEASLARAQSLVGLKGYVTNLDAEVMAATEVIGKYHDLWHVEKSFRMSKSDLEARPMFHRTREAIEAHLTIVFTALAVAHCIQERSGLSIANVIKQLRPLRTATIVINGASQDLPTRNPLAPTRNPDRTRHQTWLTKPNVLTQVRNQASAEHMRQWSELQPDLAHICALFKFLPIAPLKEHLSRVTSPSASAPAPTTVVSCYRPTELIVIRTGSTSRCNVPGAGSIDSTC